MHPNPILKRLGLSDTDRVVILHADDIGMCQAAQAAYEEMVDFGLLSSASTMVPCPWFPQTAAYCAANQADKPHLDMGVHLTLTCEWDAMRWGPISTGDPTSGLMDGEGYFPRTSEEVHENAVPAAVKMEIEAQLARALEAGIDVTHLDSHMGSIFRPQTMAMYVQLAMQHALPALVMRHSEESLVATGYPQEMAAALAGQVRTLEERGFATFDRIGYLSLTESADRIGAASAELARIPTGGMGYFIVHPAKDTPELRSVASKDWPSRVADYQLFLDERFRTHVEESDIHVIGWRALRDLMRA